MNKDQQLTLAYINGYRAAKGLKVLDEFPENVHYSYQSRSATCPIAKGLQVTAYASGTIVDLDYPDSNPDVPNYVLRTEFEFDKTMKKVK